MIDDPDRCYAVLTSRDPRYDGWFTVGVTSTGIYCRPSCPARTPKRANVRFFPTAAAAQTAGFRACRRCRPDASPGSPAWDQRADLVGRAMRLIADGVVDREGVVGLASRLGYTTRHVHRQLVAELGAGPLALARAQRAQTARVLIEATDLPFAEVAFAAGFGSVRQFNDTVGRVFGVAPTVLRRQPALRPATTDGAVTLRLPVRAPVDLGPTIAHLGARAVPGLEELTPGGGFRRSLRLPRASGTVELTPVDGGVRIALRLTDLRDLAAAVERCRRLLDLDADPAAVDAHLGSDPLLADAVRVRPGLRVAGSVDPVELAVRTLLGQQVTVAAGQTLTARLVERYGEPLGAAIGGVTHRFPTVERLATADLNWLGVPRSRRLALTGLSVALAEGRLVLDVGVDRDEVRAQLASLPGIGPWTVEEIALRGLRDPDAFPATDLALRRAAARFGLAPDGLLDRAERWRPWRAYAAEHLWALDRPQRRAA
jgi:AraC family transcriptional regulator, regulatory protein of adaptative response / DNA-3-methyladenine glycosylase II